MDTEYFIIGGKDGDMKWYNDWQPAVVVMTTRRQPASSQYHHHRLWQQGDHEEDRRSERHALARSQHRRSRIRRIELETWRAGAQGRHRVEIYCTNLDQCTNAFDRYYIAQGDKIVDVWPNVGRGGAAQR
jgi:D-serine deaminase-like pyridoxal phosphate-dependent protein